MIRCHQLKKTNSKGAFCAFIFCMLFTGCTNSGNLKKNTPVDQDYDKKFSFGALSNGGGLEFGSSSKPNTQPEQAHVNLYLWRASLDALSFAPIHVSDNIGGIISTDWYTVGHKNQRFKINVRIESKNFRADGLSVRLFKQEHRSGTWVNTPRTQIKKQEIDLQNLILDRAKTLYIAHKNNRD